jgi:hypothetical protein
MSLSAFATAIHWVSDVLPSKWNSCCAEAQKKNDFTTPNSAPK